MINVEQVKRDVVNYGTLKVYTTFLTISEDEEDPELFNSSQLKEIFNKRFDTVKININFVEMQEGEWVSIAKELLIFKLSKCSDEEVSYMSNVNDEGKLSSLVLTKSGDEVSLEVVEYEVGGGSEGKGLEIINWDGSRDFTEEELNKLFENKACVMLIDIEGPNFHYYYVTYATDVGGLKDVTLINTFAYDDGLKYASYDVLNIYDSGDAIVFDTYTYSFSDIKGTKLYKHSIRFKDPDGDDYYIDLISTRAISYTKARLIQYSDIEIVSILTGSNETDPGVMSNIFKANFAAYSFILYGISSVGGIMKHEILSENISNFVDTVSDQL